MPEKIGSELVLDVGNSRMKMGLFRGGRLVRTALATVNDDGAVRAFLGTDGAEQCVVGSVAAGNEGFLAAVGKLAPVRLITGNTPTFLLNRYTTPGTLGVDRLANAVGAAKCFPGRPVLAIDAGTCVTYDLVDERKTFLGGVITPGLYMRGKAMHAYSARLPEVEPGEDPPLPGTDTHSSLAAGMHHGMVLEMGGFISHFRRGHSGLAVVITGGDAVRAARALKSNIFAHPALTLVGLHAIAHHRTP